MTKKAGDVVATNVQFLPARKKGDRVQKLVTRVTVQADLSELEDQTVELIGEPLPFDPPPPVAA